MELIRQAGNSGKFYPSTCEEVTRFIDRCNKVSASVQLQEPIKVRAVIVPHAGYFYSGFTANSAYRTFSNAIPKRVVVIGPSHYAYFTGVSAAFFEQYETPCGNLKIDMSYLEKLNISFKFSFSKKAHFAEHSTETQMPFIRHYHPQAGVIELIYGRVEWQEIVPVIEAVLSDEDNILVISSDLSHFYPLEQASRLDNICLEAIRQKNIEMFDRGCEACGIIGIKAMIEVADKNNLQTAIVDYRTSADASGDESSVVGYASAVIW